jgi:hypothetical protein
MADLSAYSVRPLPRVPRTITESAGANYRERPSESRRAGRRRWRKSFRVQNALGYAFA